MGFNCIKKRLLIYQSHLFRTNLVTTKIKNSSSSLQSYLDLNLKSLTSCFACELDFLDFPEKKILVLLGEQLALAPFSFPHSSELLGQRFFFFFFFFEIHVSDTNKQQ